MTLCEKILAKEKLDTDKVRAFFHSFTLKKNLEVASLFYSKKKLLTLI